MSMLHTTSVKCSHCHREDSIETFASINVKDDPELARKVKDGELFIWECPSCGNRNLVKYETIYHDPDSRLMIWLQPSEVKRLTMDDAAVSRITRELDGYTLRLVPDVTSLMEKINIYSYGLEDTIMEVCKYVTKMELVEKNKGRQQEILSTTLRFYKMDGPDNELTFTFPLEGRMHAVNVGFNVYEDCRGILRRNPEMKPDEGFAVVDSVWLSRFIR